MSENPPEGLTPTESTEDTPAEVIPAPKDVSEADATGYAVFNTTIGQYVSPVTKGKPSAAEARKFLPKGHTHKIVRV